ncbi:MAG: hypothetical protein WD874_01035 [Parcubacteria group bacterium]
MVWFELKEVLLKNRKFDIEPTENGEADQERGRVSDTPDTGSIMLDIMEKRRPGFRDQFLKEQGVIPITKKP